MKTNTETYYVIKFADTFGCDWYMDAEFSKFSVTLLRNAKKFKSLEEASAAMSDLAVDRRFWIEKITETIQTQVVINGNRDLMLYFIHNAIASMDEHIAAQELRDLKKAYKYFLENP